MSKENEPPLYESDLARREQEDRDRIGEPLTAEEIEALFDGAAEERMRQAIRRMLRGDGDEYADPTPAEMDRARLLGTLNGLRLRMNRGGESPTPEEMAMISKAVEDAFKEPIQIETGPTAPPEYPIEATWDKIWESFVAVCERRSGLAPGKMKNFLGSVACHREHFMEAMERLSGGVSGAPKAETLEEDPGDAKWEEVGVKYAQDTLTHAGGAIEIMESNGAPGETGDSEAG